MIKKDRFAVFRIPDRELTPLTVWWSFRVRPFRRLVFRGVHDVFTPARQNEECQHNRSHNYCPKNPCKTHISTFLVGCVIYLLARGFAPAPSATLTW